MEMFTHLLDCQYQERPAANCNCDPYPALAKFDLVRASRDRIAKRLQNPGLSLEERSELELRRAKADQILRSVETHRQGFHQRRIIAKIKPQ